MKPNYVTTVRIKNFRKFCLSNYVIFLCKACILLFTGCMQMLAVFIHMTQRDVMAGHSNATAKCWLNYFLCKQTHVNTTGNIESGKCPCNAWQVHKVFITTVVLKNSKFSNCTVNKNIFLGLTSPVLAPTADILEMNTRLFITLERCSWISQLSKTVQ